jgi:hypothetical protein
MDNGDEIAKFSECWDAIKAEASLSGLETKTKVLAFH